MLLPRIPADTPPTLGSEFGTTPTTAPVARLDGVGIWWITWGAVWTFLLVTGMVYLFRKRDMPTLRIRGLPLTFAGLILLHLYWISVQIGYSVGPLAPAVAEFWIMSIWYPFGIALFQAGNSQFLHVAKAQSRFARPPSQMSTRFDEKRNPQKMGLFGRLRSMDYSKMMFTFVTIGMVIQLVVVVVIYLISRKFHPSFGIPGTEVTGSTPMEIAMHQGRGWEWWPSLFWQFLWAWVIAPVILWQSRGIRDTHGWKLQTVACCIAGLPAAPMWLIALYVPGMAPVNAYFVPPQWIAISIWVIEVFTVFVPCWQVRKHQNLRQETLDLIAQWESKKGAANHSNQSYAPSASGLSPTSTKFDEAATNESWKKLSGMEKGQSDSDKASDDGILTMSALEHVLEKNPEPLRQFSARRDFSGENIAFLTAVSEWKNALPPAFRRSGQDAAPDVVRQQFTKALRIYAEFISPRDAEFPINIAWHDLRKLEGVFERAARSMYGDNTRVDTATPFGETDWALQKRPDQESRSSEINMISKTPSVVDAVALGSMADANQYIGDIPAAFDSAVFDAAQDSIKYLVLTNTWPKYVRERRNSEDSSIGSQSTIGTNQSKSSLRRALAFLRPAIR